MGRGQAERSDHDMTHSRQAMLFYANGCSCEQSIFGAFAEAMGLSPVRAMQTAPRRSERRGQCGALSAACKVLCLIYARDPCAEGELGGEADEAAAMLCRLYLERWGTADCAAIQSRLARRGCDEAIAITAAMVERLLPPQPRAQGRRNPGERRAAAVDCDGRERR